jgi:ADP-ribose pyrophosphatase YjhB (NUDIX family)
VIAIGPGPRLLLFRFGDPDGGHRWVLPGGVVREGESPPDAAARVAVEQLGVDRRELAPLWVEDEEHFFLLPVDPAVIAVSVEGVLATQWWSLPELAMTPEPIVPDRLAVRLGEAAQTAYHAACGHDRAGREAEAVRPYQQALALGLPPADRRGALVGLGSSLRNVGRPAEAVRLLKLAVEEFPGDASLVAFLSLAHHSAGQGAEAVALLLDLALRHAPIGEYARALSGYRDALTAAPPGGIPIPS